MSNSIWANTLTDTHADDAPDWGSIKRQDFEEPRRASIPETRAERAGAIRTDRRSRYQEPEPDYSGEPIYYDDTHGATVPNTSREPLKGLKSYINAGLGIIFGLACLFGLVPAGMGVGTEASIGMIWFGFQFIWMRMGMSKPPKLVQMGINMGLRSIARSKR